MNWMTDGYKIIYPRHLWTRILKRRRKKLAEQHKRVIKIALAKKVKVKNG